MLFIIYYSLGEEMQREYFLIQKICRIQRLVSFKYTKETLLINVTFKKNNLKFIIRIPYKIL